MNIDDLLKKKKALTRVASVNIEGLGDVELHQLTIAERFEFLADTDKAMKGEMSDEAVFDRWAWRLLAGPSRKAKAAELKKLKALMTDDIERELYSKAMFFPVDDAVKKSGTAQIS